MAVAIVGSLAMEWKSIKKDKKKANVDAAKEQTADGIAERKSEGKAKSIVAENSENIVNEKEINGGENEVEREKSQENDQTKKNNDGGNVTAP
jgi:hypothetical protein